MRRRSFLGWLSGAVASVSTALFGENAGKRVSSSIPDEYLRKNPYHPVDGGNLVAWSAEEEEPVQTVVVGGARGGKAIRSKLFAKAEVIARKFEEEFCKELEVRRIEARRPRCLSVRNIYGIASYADPHTFHKYIAFVIEDGESANSVVADMPVKAGVLAKVLALAVCDDIEQISYHNSVDSAVVEFFNLPIDRASSASCMQACFPLHTSIRSTIEYNHILKKHVFTIDTAYRIHW